jgi:hypothetical protein
MYQCDRWCLYISDIKQSENDKTFKKRKNYWSRYWYGTKFKWIIYKHELLIIYVILCNCENEFNNDLKVCSYENM